MRPNLLRVSIFVVVTTVLSFLGVGTVHAAYPGYNGLIVFSSNGNLWTADITLGSVVAADALTYYDSGYDDDPAYSPDGTRIAFVRDQRPWVMNADASQQLQLIDRSVRGVTWAPDGTRLAYADASLGLYVIDADGTDATRISTDATAANPSWSANGARIAFDSNRDGNREIYLIDPDGTDEVRVTNSPATDQDPDWSPDSARLALSSDRDGDYDIYTVAWDMVFRNITNPRWERDTEPSWSPDGTKMAFTSHQTTWGGVFTMFSDGRNEASLVIDDGTATHESSGDWQPLAEEPIPPDFYDPVTAIVKPQNGSTYAQADLRAINGHVRELGSGVERVEIALRRYLTDGSCDNWNGYGFVAGSCTRREWQRAGESSMWTYALPRMLKKSTGTTITHYVVMARAFDRSGRVDTEIETGRNRAFFEIV